jgi:hypothetical protein
MARLRRTERRGRQSGRSEVTVGQFHPPELFNVGSLDMDPVTPVVFASVS